MCIVLNLLLDLNTLIRVERGRGGICHPHRHHCITVVSPIEGGVVANQGAPATTQLP